MRFRTGDWACALALGAAAVLAVHLYGGPSSGDDTFIYMRYTSHALAGEGFEYNPGERSDGVTSPVWLALMTPVAAACGNTLGVWKLAGCVVFGAAVFLLVLALRSAGLGAGPAVLLAGFGALEPNTLRWTSSGMENGLVLLVVVAMMTTFRSAVGGRRASAETGLGALLGLLPFVRPELAILAGVTAVAYAAPAGDGPRVRLRPLIVAGIVAGVLALITWGALGRVVPQSVWAKAFLQGQVGPSYGISTVARIVLSGAGGSLVLLACLPVSSMWLRRWRLALLVSLLVWVAALADRNQLVSSRYASYLAAPLVASAAWALAEAWRDGRRVGWRWLAAGAQVVLAASLLVYVFPVTRVAEGEEIRRLADAVRVQTDARARIALTEIGAFGFYSDRYIIDLVGLTDSEALAWRLDQQQSALTLDQLEELLVRRRATHYVDTNAGPEPLQGRRLRFRPVVERIVRRNNFSAGVVMTTVWRVYALDRLY